MSQLYLLHYNNYYNRKVHKEASIDDYQEFLVQADGNDVDENGNSNVVNTVNFIDRDYVNTEQVVNWVGDMPNYLVEYDSNKQKIRSLWFVVGHEKQNYAQYKLQLRRDLVAEYIGRIQNQPMFVEKATPSNLNDPAIFNNEDMTFNQIKTEEVLLKDATNTPWIIGYIPRDSKGGKVTVDYNHSGLESISVTQINQYTYYSYTQNNCYGNMSNAVYKCNLHGYVPGTITFGKFTPQWYDFSVALTITSPSDYGSWSGSVGSKRNSGSSYSGSVPLGFNDYHAKADDNYLDYGGLSGTSGNATGVESYAWQSSIYGWTKNVNNLFNYGMAEGGFQPSANYNLLDAENGKIIFETSTGKYYKVRVSTQTREISEQYVSTGSNLYNYLNENLIRNSSSTPGNTYPIRLKLYGNANSTSFTFQCSVPYKRITLEEVNETLTATILGSNDRYHLSDSPYDMFCIPYPQDRSLYIYENGSPIIYNVDAYAGFAMAINIAAQLSAGEIYDVQLLPYCPIKDIIKGNRIDLGGNYQRSYITKGENDLKCNIVVFATSSEFSVDIPYSIPVETNVLQKKIKSETEMWRLCSPNYSGVYEFNPQMNNGVSTFHVDCNYKPFSPYIHVHPVFSGLYGNNFEDSRGLVCGGDFSLPQVTSAWTNYQYQNKNYQEMFDRGIQNQQINNAVQREKEGWQIAAGTMQAYAQGKSAGDSTFLGLGGLLGIGNITGAASAGFSLAAGLKDRELNDRLRQEGLDYSKDMFGYQLGNIQALNQGLAKVSAFTKNNKIFPFLEKYTCDVQGFTYQVDALKNKLKYNGYTIMRVGTISEFINTEESYIKGKLIRLPEDFMEDFHIGAALADELFQGIFIKNNLSKLEET